MADETLVEDAKDPEPQEGSPPPEEPKAEEVEGEAPKAAEETPKKKRGRRKKEDAAGDTPKKEGTPRVRKKKEPAEPATPVERPSRERKTVERFSALTPQKSAAKVLSIEQGPGTKLKDIPNVLFKLNKRKVDDNLQHLHTVLFSKRAKVHHIKKNIFQFSGFVWTDNKEKSRAKVREKLDKYNKDRLLDFCETLDIPVNKAATKKEDVSAKLLEFLESPHVTRDVVIADKEQRSKKRKRTRKGASGESEEKRKRGRKPSVRADNNDAEEMEVEGDSAGEEEKEDAPQQDDIVNSGPEDAEAEEKSSDDEEDEPGSPAEKKASVVKKGSKSKNNEKETPKKSSDSKSVKTSPSHEESEGKKGAKRGRKPAMKASGEDKPDLKISAKKGASAAKGEDDKNKKKNKKSPKEKHDDKQVSKASSKTTKEKGKAKSSGKADVTPTREEMHAVVSEILKEVDFNTATLADILKQLGAHFKKDLMDRKAEVKSIIEDVINSMSDDDGDGDEEGDGAEEKDNADGSSGEGDA